MYESLSELYGYDSKQTFNFFHTNLIDTLEEMPEEEFPIKKRITPKETLYSTSVLAHYAQTSTTATGETLNDFPAPKWIVDIFDNFIIPSTAHFEDSQLLEIAGTQTLLMRGFFRDYTILRNPGEWYDNCGSGFFMRASTKRTDPNYKHLLERMAQNFIFWAVCFQRLHKYLREKPYIIQNRP